MLCAFLPLLEIFNNTAQQSSPRQRRYDDVLFVSRSSSSIENLAPSSSVARKKGQKTVWGGGLLQSFACLKHLLLSLPQRLSLAWLDHSLLSYISMIGKTVFSRSSFSSSSSARLCYYGRSRFILIGSILGRVQADAVPGQEAYCASKAALRVLSERCREKTKEKGVHIVLVGKDVM